MSGPRPSLLVAGLVLIVATACGPLRPGADDFRDDLVGRLGRLMLA